MEELSLVLETGRDITARRHAEQSLHFHLQLNKAITEQAVDPIFVVGGTGEIIFANPEAERVFGWKLEELIGRQLHETLHHEFGAGNIYPAGLCPLLDAQLNGKVVRGIELVFFHRDGSPVAVSCSNAPLFFKGQEIGAVLIIRDIAQQKSMEQALLQSEERLRLAVAAAQIGTWDLNLLSGAVTMDENCRKTLGLDTAGQNFITSWLRAVHPDDRALARKQIEAALDDTGDGQFHLECRTVRRPGGDGIQYMQAQGQAFFEEQGSERKATRLIGTIQDVTGRKCAEYALKRANEDLQQFAYAAAHDLQEPLRNIVNLLGLYKRNQSQGVADEHELIDASMEDARRMHQMVIDLLSFTDIHKSFEKAEISADAAAVLRDVTQNLASNIAEAGAEIASDPLPVVRIQSTHLLQLFQNLLSNALKYRRENIKPFIHIGVRRKGSDWMFSVADNGIGFDPAYAKRIFGVFKRLHGRAEYAGSGIGLAICSRIVHTYAGRIWAEGQVGRGATFYFTLPVATEPR